MAARILRLSFPVQQEPVVTECLKADPAVGQFYVFRHGTMVNALSPDPPESQEICRIEFQVEGKRVSHAIKSLRQIGLGASFGDIDVAPLSCSTQTLPHTRRSERCCRSFAARMPTLEIHAAIVGGSHLTAEHVLLIVLASIMAACGLLTDNLVLILASFFISPLMSMIVAATWGLVVGDGRLCVRGLRNTLLGMLLCLASGTCIALLLSVQPDAAGLEAPLGVGPGVYRAISINTVQILERGPPAAEPLLIALLVGSMSGVAVALAQSSGIVSALSGVTLSASLLPPVVNAGLMFAFAVVYPDVRTRDGYHLFDVSLVSLALYAVNVACIIAFAFATFKLKRISGLTLRSLGAAAEGFESDDDLDVDTQTISLEAAGCSPSSSRRPLLARWQSQSMPLLPQSASEEGMRAPQSAKSAPRLSVSPLDAARLSEPPEDAAPAPSTEVSTLSSS